MKVLGLFLFAAVFSGPVGPEYIEISKAPGESARTFPGWRVEAPFPSQAEIHADLGDSIEGQILAVGGEGDTGDEIRAQIRYETSVTIMNEGPHLDLVGWKHYTSEWREVTRLSPNRFRLPVLTEEQTTMFPAVTVQDIQEAVLAAGGERWANLVQDIGGPRDYPAAVGLSSIQLRIQKREQQEWNTLMTIIVYMPMGC